MQAILLCGCDASAMRYASGFQNNERQSSEQESYSRSAQSSEKSSSGYQMGEMASAGVGMSSGYGGSGYSSGGGYQQGNQVMRSQEVTTTTTTTTTTTYKAVEYIQSNFQEVGSKSMGYSDDKDAMVLKSFVEKDNGCFLTSLLKEPCNKKLITCELGLDNNIQQTSLISYFKNALYLKERKIHRAALALKRCRLNTKGYHRTMVPRIDVLNHIGMTFTCSKSNSQEMMKQWHEFAKYKNGLYFQSFCEDQTMWGELASQIGYTGRNAEDFRIYLLRNRFRKERKTCKIAKCMRGLRKKHCGGKCAKRPKHVKRTVGCGGPGKPGKCGGGGCGGGGVKIGVSIGGGGCGGKCGKC
uniref:Salivap-3 n=1 Tax=Nilaparvata lugens TaxID=108931 RepID=A0A191UR50_NILLU|nr:salivap-3 [Nilaparvata lugens]